MVQIRTSLSVRFPGANRRRPTWLALALACTLGACAQSEAGPDAGGGNAEGVRVICRLTEARSADNRLALELARAAGMPVQRLQGIQDNLVAVEFRCAPALRCEQGLARLRSVSPLVAEVTLDGQAQVPRQPVRPQERP